MKTIPDIIQRKFVCTSASISAKQVIRRFGKVQALNSLIPKVDSGATIDLPN